MNPNRTWNGTFRKKTCFKIHALNLFAMSLLQNNKNKLIMTNKWNNEFCQLKYRPQYWIWNFWFISKNLFWRIYFYFWSQVHRNWPKKCFDFFLKDSNPKPLKKLIFWKIHFGILWSLQVVSTHQMSPFHQ